VIHHYLALCSPKLITRHPGLRSQKELINEYQIVVQDSGSQTRGKTFGVQDGQRCWHVSDLSTKKMLTLSGMGWGNLPLFLIENELKNGELVKLKLSDARTEFKLNYHVMKLHHKLLGPVTTSLWQRLTKL
jgi:DNA-binding transcriptional LysR family regulator